MFRSFFKRRKAPLAAFALVTAPFAAQAACTGENAVEALRQSDPAAYQTIATAADKTPHGEGVFWRIDAPNVAPSYLFGTKHTIDRDITQQIAPVQEVIRSARVMMVELSPQEQAEMANAMQSDPKMLVDMSGATIEDFLPPDLIPRAQEIFAQYGLPYEAGKRMHPWFLQMVMALPPCALALQQSEPEKVMDNVLAQTAIGAGVDVQGLEKWEDQINIFRGMSDGEAKNGLIYALASFDEKVDEYQAVADLYDEQQIALIWEFSRWRLLTADHEFETTAEDAVAELERTLIIDRNRLMVSNAKAEVAKGGVVIAVGAMHMIGESGLVAAFEREGYSITRLE